MSESFKIKKQNIQHNSDVKDEDELRKFQRKMRWLMRLKRFLQWFKYGWLRWRVNMKHIWRVHRENKVYDFDDLVWDGINLETGVKYSEENLLRKNEAIENFMKILKGYIKEYDNVVKVETKEKIFFELIEELENEKH